jgi:chlorite dismutase
MSNPAAESAVSASSELPTPPTPTEYTLWAVLRRDPANPDDLDGHDVPRAVAQLDATIATIQDEGVTLRGIYDVSSIRADADIMLWVHGESPEGLQWAVRELRRTQLLKGLLPTWNAMGVHRDAEFSANHLPAYMRGKEPAAWLTVYPFVRSYEWYLLPAEERRDMLMRHGRAGAEFRSVLTNTVASFALGDYEWILALEDDELLNLVDLMRAQRSTDARMHVRTEVPFYTGRLITTAEVVEVVQ